MTSARQVHYTYREYLAALEVSELRLEYLDGEIFAMAGEAPSTACWPRASFSCWAGFSQNAAA